MVCPLCLRSRNVLLMNLTVNIVTPFVFVTGTQCILCDVGSETSYMFRYFFRNSHQQTTCDSLFVLFNVILYIEIVLTISAYFRSDVFCLKRTVRPVSGLIVQYSTSDVGL